MLHSCRLRMLRDGRAPPTHTCRRWRHCCEVRQAGCDNAEACDDLYLGPYSGVRTRAQHIQHHKS